MTRIERLLMYWDWDLQDDVATWSSDSTDWLVDADSLTRRAVREAMRRVEEEIGDNY